MATLQTIRNRGGLLVSIVIGLALIAFIVGDALNSGSRIFNSQRNWRDRRRGSIYHRFPKPRQ